MCVCMLPCVRTFLTTQSRDKTPASSLHSGWESLLQGCIRLPAVEGFGNLEPAGSVCVLTGANVYAVNLPPPNWPRPTNHFTFWSTAFTGSKNFSCGYSSMGAQISSVRTVGGLHRTSYKNDAGLDGVISTLPTNRRKRKNLTLPFRLCSCSRAFFSLQRQGCRISLLETSRRHLGTT